MPLGGGGARAGGTCFVDGTFGRGGHSRLILQRLGAAGRLLAFDKDPAAIRSGAHRGCALCHPAPGLFAAGRAACGQSAGVLLDLGVSSPQIDDPGRGFSFRFDGPLDMRMDTTRGQSVADWLADAEAGRLRR